MIVSRTHALSPPLRSAPCLLSLLPLDWMSALVLDVWTLSSLCMVASGVATVLALQYLDAPYGRFGPDKPSSHKRRRGNEETASRERATQGVAQATIRFRLVDSSCLVRACVRVAVCVVQCGVHLFRLAGRG